MITWAFLAVWLVQEEPIESLIRKLDSETVQERDRAAAELRRRGEAVMDALQKAERKAVEPSEKARLRRALEEVLGYRPLTLERIRAQRLSCSLGHTKARAAAAELARLSGLPVDVDAPAGFDPEVSELSGHDTPLEHLLDALARQSGGIWILEGRRILLFISGKVPLRLFDVRDLTIPMEDDRWVHLEPDESDSPPESASGTCSAFTGEDLVALVKNQVSPKGWEEADGKSIQFQNGLMIIRNDAEVLRAVEAYLEACRRKAPCELKIEIEAYAVKAGTKVEEMSIEKLREDAAEGRAARRVSWFERTTPDKRRIGLSTLTRLVLLTGHDPSGAPLTSPFSTGARANLRASLDHDRSIVRVELQAGWSRLVSLDKKSEAAGEVQIPTFASHTLRLSLGVTTGRFAVLGRIGETKLVDGLGDIVVLGRFTPLERP